MSNTRVQLLLLISFLVFLQIPGSVDANSITDNLVPQDERSEVGSVDLEYNRYPTSHYQVDLYVEDAGSAWWPGNWGDHISNESLGSLHFLFNGAWMANIVWVFFVMNVVEQSFSLDFVGNVVSIIAESIRSVAGFDGGISNGGVWGALVLFILVLVGTWAAYVGIMKRETSRALSGILSSLVIFVCALGFFANADRMLTMMNDASADLQNSILSGASTIVSPGQSYSQNEGIAAIRNQMHDILVERPYLLMQYGTSSKTSIEAEGEGRVDNLLSVSPYSEEREEYVAREVEQYENRTITSAGIVDRLLFLPLVTISNLLIGGMLLIISCMIIMYQILFLVLVLFAPVPLLLGMIPSMQTAATNWVLKVIHAQLMKIGIALLLTILFSVSAILYQAADDSQVGYLLMMVIQILCFVGIWMKRRDIFGLITQASGGVVSSTGSSGQQLNNYRRKIQNAMYNRATRNLLQNKNSNAPNQVNGSKSKAAGIKGRIDALKERPGVGVYKQDDLAERRKKKEAAKGMNSEASTTAKHSLNRKSGEGKKINKEIAARKQEPHNQAQEFTENHAPFEGMDEKERKQEMERLRARQDHDKKAIEYSKRQPQEAAAASGQNEVLTTKEYQRKPSGLSKATLAERDINNPENPKIETMDAPKETVDRLPNEKIYQSDATTKKQTSVLKQRQPIEQETKSEVTQDIKNKDLQHVKTNETQDRLTKEDKLDNLLERKEVNEIKKHETKGAKRSEIINRNEQTNTENRKDSSFVSNRDHVETDVKTTNEKSKLNRNNTENQTKERHEKHVINRNDVTSSETTVNKQTITKRSQHHEEKELNENNVIQPSRDRTTKEFKSKEGNPKNTLNKQRNLNHNSRNE